MPTTPRKRTPAARTSSAGTQTSEAPPATAPEPEAAAKPEPAAAGGSTLSGIVLFPLRLSRTVAQDVVVTARRPEAVLYWGGLAALAALGVLDWPAAAALGVGVAVAAGARRTRS